VEWTTVFIKREYPNPQVSSQSDGRKTGNFRIDVNRVTVWDKEKNGLAHVSPENISELINKVFDAARKS
jgi:predicted Rdx family selenoprotein